MQPDEAIPSMHSHNHDCADYRLRHSSEGSTDDTFHHHASL
jgi:hypothetical protein